MDRDNGPENARSDTEARYVVPARRPDAATTRDADAGTRTLWVQVARIYLMALVPVLLLLASVRLVLTPAYLWLEYHRPGFPEDYYGFTTEDRLRYGPYGIEYLLNAEDIEFLGLLRFPDGTPLFNARELQHMRDVKAVTQVVFAAGIGLAASFAILAVALWRRPATREALRQALFNGALLTLGIIAAIIILSIVSWDTFFTGFHRLFFAEGTWQFFYSDTLIRLYPEAFWFDTAIVLGALTSLGALALLALTWRRKPA